MSLTQALKTIMEVKTVDYDFEFYQLPQWADAPVTILSDGPSMFKDSVDLVVPLQPEQSLGEPPTHLHPCIPLGIKM